MNEFDEVCSIIIYKKNFFKILRFLFTDSPAANWRNIIKEQNFYFVRTYRNFFDLKMLIQDYPDQRDK